MSDTLQKMKAEIERNLQQYLDEKQFELIIIDDNSKAKKRKEKDEGNILETK